MSDEPPGDEPDRPTDESPADRHSDDERRNRESDDRSRSDGWLSSLLTALERLDESSKTDRRRSNRATFDSTISIGSISGEIEDARDRRRRSESSERESSSGRPRKRRRRSDGRHHVTTQTRDDEVLVTADLAGVDPEDVTVGFDDTTLVIGVDGNAIERVRIPWAESTADATLHNGILTVTVEPDPGVNDRG